MIYNDDCLKVLRTLPDNSVDSLVTDPPAGISFMNKSWDDDKGGRDAWIEWMTEVMAECLRVMKPGASGLVWALPRTSHWTATALENAGFEIRDTICHLFGSGFPKSLDISKSMDKMAGAEREVVGMSPNWRPAKTKGGAGFDKIGNGQVEIDITAPSTPEAKQWEGWGTGLKPAHEVWWLIRKPLSEKNVASNILKWGVGGINIDECRIGTDETSYYKTSMDVIKSSEIIKVPNQIKRGGGNNKGRFPSNIIHDGSDCIVKEFPDDSSRFFYQAKPSASERNEGLYGFEEKDKAAKDFRPNHAEKAENGEDGNPYGRWGKVKNNHPTLKSIALMEYLIKLTTPPKGVTLDPFMGSGTTGCAARYWDFEFIGIEKELEYFEIAKARIEHWATKPRQIDLEELIHGRA